jgi:hypothetical protein
MALKFTDTTTDDRELVLDLTSKIFGKLYGDKGYISKTLKKILMEKKGLSLLPRIEKI